MVKMNAFELWGAIEERLSPPDLKTFISLFKDFEHRRIEKTQLIASCQLLFNDELLHQCFTDFFDGKKTQEEEQEDEDAEATDIEEGEIRERDPKTAACVRNKESTTRTQGSKRKLEAAMEYDEVKEICKTVSKILSPFKLLKLVSSIKDLGKQKISHSEFRKSVGLLFKNKGQEDEYGKTKQDVEDTDLEEGEIREDRLLRDTNVEQAESNPLATRAEVDEKSKEDAVYHCDPKIGCNVGIEFSKKGELEKDVTNGVQKTKLEGKKRRILQQEPIVRSPKKTRTSRRLQPVRPSYKLILDEEQCHVPVLKNKCSLKKFGDDWGNRTLTNYEVEMAKWEKDMCEANMLMETLKSAVEKADKVIRKEMRVKDLGVKFFKCIEWLYHRDMKEIVKQHHDQMLPVISHRLKQKLDEVTVARRKLEAVWKKAFEENTAKQRESTA